MSAVHADPSLAGRAVPRRSRKRLSRFAFYAHLWVGVLITVASIAIAITGVLLNHKQWLGLMPDVSHEPTQPFAATLPLELLAYAALEAAPQSARKEWKPGDAVTVHCNHVDDQDPSAHDDSMLATNQRLSLIHI